MLRYQTPLNSSEFLTSIESNVFGYCCEVCMVRSAIETKPVPLYYRIDVSRDPDFKWPAHMDWIPLCDKHSKGYIPYKEKIVLTGTEPIFKEDD